MHQQMHLGELGAQEHFVYLKVYLKFYSSVFTNTLKGFVTFII